VDGVELLLLVFPEVHPLVVRRFLQDLVGLIGELALLLAEFGEVLCEIHARSSGRALRNGLRHMARGAIHARTSAE
jgi:hypothetical protein